VPVQTREEEVLFRIAGRRNTSCRHIRDLHQEGDAVGALCRGDRRGALSRCDCSCVAGGNWTRGRQRDRVGVRVQYSTHAPEAVVREEEEEPVMNDWSADRATKLLLLVNRLR